MKILITGDSAWGDRIFIINKFKDLQESYPNNEPFTLLHFGTLRGVDMMVSSLGRLKNVYIKKYRAKNRLLKSKCLRNDRLLKFDRPQLIWIFHNNIGNSSGFQDLIAKSERRNIPINIFYYAGSDFGYYCEYK